MLSRTGRNRSLCIAHQLFSHVVRLSPLGTAATTGLLYQLQMTDDDDDCGAIGGMKIGRGNRNTRRKPAPVSLCPPQILHDLTWARTRAAAVERRRLTDAIEFSYWQRRKVTLQQERGSAPPLVLSAPEYRATPLFHDRKIPFFSFWLKFPRTRS
jgi:hypothetical protein